MISSEPNEFETNVMIANILRVYDSATPEQRVRGEQWYPVAHGLAAMIADGDVRVGAGLLAAMSPQTSWYLNIELAADAYETGSPSRHLRDACDKAAKILAGIDPEDVLPMHRKTGHFYRCIVDPSDDWTVCVDRHAHDIAVGQRYGQDNRGLSATGRYNKIADAYRHAAREIGIIPQQLQAITWVVWTDKEN